MHACILCSRQLYHYFFRPIVQQTITLGQVSEEIVKLGGPNQFGRIVMTTEN